MPCRNIFMRQLKQNRRLTALIGRGKEMRQMDLEQTMAEHGDCILRLCFLILRDRAAAEDAAQ